jgi:hypothetical protein
MLAACARRNSAQLVSRRWGAGLDPGLLEDRPDRARGEPDPEPDQLPLDPPVAPAGVLLGEPHHELTDLRRGRRSARTAARVRPAARDQLAVPTQQRRRRHKHGSPPRLPRQRTAERRQQRPISRRQPRTSNLTLQYPQLLAQHQNLDLLLRLRPTSEHDQLEQPPQRPIEKRQERALGLTLWGAKTLTVILEWLICR